MLTKTQYQILIGLAALSLVMTLIDMYLAVGNRHLNEQVSARAQYIQQSGQLQSFFNVLARNMAQLADKDNDSALGDLLASQGIKPNGDVPAVPAPPSDKGTPLLRPPE